ncbi:MAG TPA: ATP synthase F1 subunit gamma [Patescibacteria group bacterium]|nr:ATP synthase F1 subunit gamma [Patescibacteria group bacterium]
MASARDIRRRIKSVRNIEQITKAMKMVAAARLRRAQEKAIASRPYTEKIREVLTQVTATVRDSSHPLLETREVKRVGYLLLSADKGLAGAYSSNLIREVMPHFKDQDHSRFGLITVGRKVRDYFKRRNYPVDVEYTGFSEKPSYQNAVNLAALVAERFCDGTYDEIHLGFTQFISPVHLKPTVVRLLPVTGESETTAEAAEEVTEYIFEPSADEVMNQLLPKYLETVIYGALLQSAASELSARMTAMGSATDNAQELISKLVLHYNKVRQANITREISEIVGGAEALK